MESVHKAQGLHLDGNIDAAREEILRARSRFEAADSVAPNSTKAKISAALGVLDGLSGGITDETKKLPEIDDFLPKLPRAVQTALQMFLMQSIQAINPAEWLTEPDRAVQKWMDIQGITTPTQVQKFLEESVKEREPEHHEDPKKKKK